MNRRTNGGAGKMPSGQTSRGFPVVSGPNPKNNATRRPDHTGNVPGEGGAALINDPDNDAASSSWQQGEAGNRFGKGSAGSLPDPARINRGYTQNSGSLPGTTNTGANRQRFGIDPGQVAQPNGDDTDNPGVPKFGVGTTGD